MTFTRFGAAIVLATVASLAGAQGAATPAKKELVAKVLKLQQGAIEGIGNQIAMQTTQQLMGGTAATLERMPADKREAVSKELQAELRKFYDDIAPTLRAAALKLAPETMGTAMEERFSEDELKAVIAWLESPASKKLQQASAELPPLLVQKIVAETRGSIEPKIQALQVSVGKKLGLSAPAAAASAAAPAAKPAASVAKK